MTYADRTDVPAAAVPTVRVPRPDDREVLALAAEYAGHPAAPSQWTADFVATAVPPDEFRSDAAYVRQGGGEREYALTYDYVRRHDALGLAGRLEEDGAFGAEGFRFDGKLWTRDVLDSISELNFLTDELPGLGERPLSIIDIGAGYGRFAHRCRAAFPRSRLVLCDAVPFSTVLSRFYLEHRGVEHAEPVALPRLPEAVRGRRFDLAVSMHAFNEMPLAAVGWWIELVAGLDVPYLFLVPNDVQGLRAKEHDRTRTPFDLLLSRAGYVLEVARDKYRHDALVQRDGLYPGMYMLYARRPGTGR